MSRFLHPITCFFLAVSPVIAAPSMMSAKVFARTELQFGSPVDELSLTTTVFIPPGGSGHLDSLNSAFGAAVDVTYDFEASGFQRTITLLFKTTDGSPFVTQAAIDSMTQPPANGNYALFFGIDIHDLEFTGNFDTFRDVGLFGDGIAISDPGPAITAILDVPRWGFSNHTSPALPGFFGASVIADEFRYSVSYIAPEPSSAALLVLGIFAMRRRR